MAGFSECVKRRRLAARHGVGRAGQDRTGQDWTGQDGTGQDETVGSRGSEAVW